MENPLIAEKGGGGGSAGGGADEPTPQLFCLRWNNYQSNLTNVFDQLLQNESFVDVTLACSDGHSMKAHKVVLSACSPFFQTLLIDNPCKHPIVILNNIKWTELKAAVDFMYKGEINVCQEQIGPLLKVAESLKIRGLADVNNEQDFTSERKSPSATTAAALSASVEMNRSPIRVNSSNCLKRRRRASPDRGSSTNTEETLSVINSPSRALELVTSPSSSVGNGPSLPGCGITGVAGVQATAGAQNSAHSGGNRPSQSSTPQSPSNLNSSLSLPPPSAPLPGTSVADDMEIKPGIAEMIREEERAKLLESSHAAWLNPATSSIAYYQHSPTLTPPPLPLLSPVGDNNKKRNNYNNNKKSVRKKMKTPTWTKSKLREAMHAVITQKLRFTQAAAYYHIPKGTLYDNILADSYQYQLQSMWQKCWSTNQSLVHNLRFRERGPLKSWRPETMAEAILSVLKEGLSLSQAARKYDIPYPTFVLYANRVHNMLGPSADGGSDLRPKGRGRPQRILLGYWPEDHIQNVIRAVVFRDPSHVKDEPLNLGYPRISCFQEPINMYPNNNNNNNNNNNSCLNSPEGPVSPNSTAAAVAAMAGLRHQFLAAAAAHNSSDNNFNFFSSPCANGNASLLINNTSPLQSPHSTPPASPGSNENLEVGLGVTGIPFNMTDNIPVKSEMLFQDEIEDLVIKTPHSRAPSSSAEQPKPLPLVLEQRSD